MDQNRYPRPLLALFLSAALVAVACGDNGFEVIEETEFAASLGVDLSAMTRTASGLYVQDLELGTGEPAVVPDEVTVSYQGWLSNGDSFDAGTFTFQLGGGGPVRAIDGFDEGVTGMSVDGTRLVVIPSELGYGAVGSGSIPGGAVLVFRFTLLSINGAD